MKPLRVVLVAAAVVSLSAFATEEEWSNPPASQQQPATEAAPEDAPVARPPPTRRPRPAPAAPASEEPIRAPEVKQEAPKTWSDTARFFVGARTGVGVPPGGLGVAPTAGLEVGVSAESGIGFGLHFISVWNPPDAP